MKIKRYVRSYLLYIIIGLLVATTAASALTISTIVDKKNSELKTANAQIEEATQKLLEAEQKLQKEQAAKDKLSKKLEQSEKENDNLEKQNKVYKKELEKLSAKKKAEVEKKVAKKTSPQSKYPKATKTCYLTFDDGPSDNTLKILKILKEYDAKATFFVIGTAKLEYLPKIKAGGHAIGLHSNTHTYSQIYKSTTAFFKDLNKISDKVEDKIGEKVTIMRFPGGSNNTVSKRYSKGVMTKLTTQVKIKGYSYFDWNVDSGDASGNNVAASRITKNVLNQAKNKNSICVLMHDTAAKGTTVKALPGILDGLKKQGYKFEVLTEETYGYHYKVNN
jgi:peptidoglycan/xylan/chitin deacetylase (PgdA/CDA1 family)